MCLCTYLSVLLTRRCNRLQANYQLVLPNIEDYLIDIGAAVTMAGVVIGCCDVASIPGTIGEYTSHSQQYLHCFETTKSMHLKILLASTRLL